MSTEAAPSETCEHRAIQAFFSDPSTGGDGTSLGMWACADCRVRFYPACRVCVDVGHRNIEHPARAALEPRAPTEEEGT